MAGKGERHCPLCGARPPGDDFCNIQFRHGQVRGLRQRRYLRCGRCALVWLAPHQRPSRADELAEYRQHNNDPHNPAYRKHLARLTRQIVAPWSGGCRDAAAKGLDFGSGPGPAIQPMLAELGFEVVNYDPNFNPDETTLQQRYDFITCTEAAEHFHHPAREFAILARALKPGGRLGLMTRLLMPDIDFATWFYIRPLSHVTFYAPETMQWIAAKHDWKVEIIPPDITVFDT